MNDAQLKKVHKLCRFLSSFLFESVKSERSMPLLLATQIRLLPTTTTLCSSVEVETSALMQIVSHNESALASSSSCNRRLTGIGSFRNHSTVDILLKSFDNAKTIRWATYVDVIRAHRVRARLVQARVHWVRVVMKSSKYLTRTHLHHHQNP